jgi:acetylornithine deacetylase/succinyl-diaminopimelate desuccinylase-like protein
MTRWVTLSADERELLVRLLELPTAGPLESGTDVAPRLWEAQQMYARAAAKLGMTIVHHAPAPFAALAGPDVPSAVLDAAARIPGFLTDQPSLVLRLGPALPPTSTIMFNVHLDTVAGEEPVTFDGARFTGRGAIDAKGPAVALLAGVRAARERAPSLGTTTSVLIQAVAGEEGGAMGVFGTRPLVEAGHIGRVNIFCEPTGCRLLPRATAAMTPCLSVTGRDAIDDDPGAGHNATVLLGFLAQHLAADLCGLVPDGQVCVAGLHTGSLHNRVYGSGRLLLNISYGSDESAKLLESALIASVDSGIAAFAERFGGIPALHATAADAAAITTLSWLKRGLPALADTDPEMTELLARQARLDRWPATEPAFTCDAIWLAGVPGAYTAVYGPGDLAANHAHAAGEYAELAELERFADGISRLLTCLTDERTPT